MSADSAPSSYYTEQGDDYLARRSNARSGHVQALRATLFRDLECDTLLDFGCGTGGILSNLDARRKIGVEVGEEAAEVARSSGIEVFGSLADVPANVADVAISFHALEHVDDDVGTLVGIRRALKPGGRLRVVVPGELPIRNHRRWQEDRDKHLRTWTPLTLGNLAERAGFTDISARRVPPPSNSRGVKIFGKPYRYVLGVRDNSFSIVVDARK
jgi:SAM-dependent methyltransferase